MTCSFNIYWLYVGPEAGKLIAHLLPNLHWAKYTEKHITEASQQRIKTQATTWCLRNGEWWSHAKWFLLLTPWTKWSVQVQILNEYIIPRRDVATVEAVYSRFKLKMNLVKVKIKKMKYIQLVRKCKTFLVEMSLMCLKIKDYFHVSGFTIILALIHIRLFSINLWPTRFGNSLLKRRGWQIAP